MSDKTAFRAGRDLPAVSENVELLTGQRGDGQDKAVTYRVLAAIGLANLKKASSSGKYTLTLPNQADSEKIERPVAPTGVIANGAFQSVLIEWDKPAYSGHAYAEIWRANEDNLSSAVMVGTSAANLFSDQIGKGSHVWYWIRFVNRSNTTGPYNSASGTPAITSSDVQDILDELQGQIEYSHLASWLRQDIETQSETAASLVQTISSLDSDMRANGQNILAQQTAILEQFSQIITDINAIRAQVNDNSALVANEQTARATQDQALAQSISSVSTSFSTETAQLDSRCDDLEYAYSDPEGAIAKKFTQVTANMTSADNQLGSAITQESQARVNAVEAVAEQVETVSASLNGVTAAVQEHASAIASINEDGSTAFQAMWAVKAQVGDITTGIGILTDSNGKSQVMISASQLFVFDPNSVAPTAPLFAIDNGAVVISTAIIRKATIQVLQSETIVADEVKAGISMSAPAINGGSISIGSNFTVNANGELSAWSATLRYVTSNYGTFNYANINYATMRNCVIEEDCVVKGTIYANKIVGGVYSQKDFPSDYNADITAGNGYTSPWITAKRINVARGMDIERRIELGGDYAHYKVITGSVAGNIPASFNANMRVGYRIIRDGSVVIAEGLNEQSFSSSIAPGGFGTFTGPIGVSAKTVVPGDGLTHYYDLQYRSDPWGVIVTQGPNASLTIGSSSSDVTKCTMYINSDDLA